MINEFELLRRIPDFDLPTDTVGACELRIIIASMPKIDILKRIDELEAQHPYKVQGQPDTYSSYNEAWCDALDAVRAYVETLSK